MASILMASILMASILMTPVSSLQTSSPNQAPPLYINLKTTRLCIYLQSIIIRNPAQRSDVVSLISQVSTIKPPNLGYRVQEYNRSIDILDPTSSRD
jgi:hypothetical protein